MCANCCLVLFKRYMDKRPSDFDLLVVLEGSGYRYEMSGKDYPIQYYPNQCTKFYNFLPNRFKV